MNRHTSKLHHQEETTAQTQNQQQNAQQQTTVQFDTAEEMLRHDAAQTDLPPAVAERLKASVAREGKSCRSFWQRVFGR